MTPAGVTRVDLARALRASWQRDTSSDPDRWEAANAAFGQCAVTALVVQDFLGGELLRTTVGDVSHYWNELGSGDELDLTRHQFAIYQPKGRYRRTREYVLSFPETRYRYARLLKRVVDFLECERAAAGEMATSLYLEHS